MNYQGSFWVRKEAKCFYKPRIISPCLTINAREEYANISENRLITRMLLEKYADGAMAVYVSARTHAIAGILFSSLEQNFNGYITMLANYGPISLNAPLKSHADVQNFENVFITIDQIETINPVQIRQKLLAFIKEEEVVEY